MGEARFCESCGAGLHEGAQFCGSCGRDVVAGTVTSSTPPPAPVATTPTSATGVNPSRVWAVVLGAVALVAVVVVLLVTGGDDGSDGDDAAKGSTTATKARVTRLEPVGAVTPAAFTGSIGAVPEKAITGAPALASTSVAGGTVGLYGGSGDTKVCDAEQLIAYLGANADKAKAFSGVLGIGVGDIPTYVRGLTPVLLTRDTRVTNHGFANGAATTVPAVLQAGTAVLVDRYGVPRVKCGCGNPLTPPASSPPVRTVGTPWAGYDRTTVIVVVAAPRAVDSFVLVNTAGSGYVRITVGSTGTISVLTAAQYCVLNPTDPACTATTTAPPTTVPPTTAPPTAPPTVPTNSPEDAVAAWIVSYGYSYAGDCASASGAGANSLCTTLVVDNAVAKSYMVGVPDSEYLVQVTVAFADGRWSVSDVQDIGAVG